MPKCLGAEMSGIRIFAHAIPLVLLTSLYPRISQSALMSAAAHVNHPYLPDAKSQNHAHCQTGLSHCCMAYAYLRTAEHLHSHQYHYLCGPHYR